MVVVVANGVLVEMVCNNVLATSFDDASLDDMAFVVRNSIVIQNTADFPSLACDTRILHFVLACDDV